MDKCKLARLRKENLDKEWGKSETPKRKMMRVSHFVRQNTDLILKAFEDFILSKYAPQELDNALGKLVMDDDNFWWVGFKFYYPEIGLFEKPDFNIEEFVKPEKAECLLECYYTSEYDVYDYEEVDDNLPSCEIYPNDWFFQKVPLEYGLGINKGDVNFEDWENCGDKMGDGVWVHKPCQHCLHSIFSGEDFFIRERLTKKAAKHWYYNSAITDKIMAKLQAYGIEPLFFRVKFRKNSMYIGFTMLNPIKDEYINTL